MMHEAYNVYPLTKLSVHIESIAAYDNIIILGTRNGHLLTYSVERNKNDSKMELQLLIFDKNFSKKPVVQIEVVPKEFLLFTLSDNMISASYINGMKFSHIYTALETKGASLFCVHEKTSESMTCEMKNVITVCIAIKRKLQFYIWENRRLLDMKIVVELKDLPKAISMFNEYICVGFKDEYVLYDISEVPPLKHDLIVTSSSYSRDPCICLLKDVFGLIKDQFLVGVNPNEFPNPNKDNKKNDDSQIKPKTELAPERITLSKNSERCKLLKPLIWSQSVLDLVWDEPYIIGRTANCLEIRCFDSNGLNKETLVQSFPDLGKAKFLKCSGKGAIFAAAISELWFIQSVDISKQIQSLQAQKKFQLAIDLTNTSDKPELEKEEIIKKIQTRFAKELFITKEFSAAMQEFAKSQTDPYDVIRLFPNLFPNDNPRSSPSHNDPNIPILEDKDLERALLALQDYLAFARQEENERINKVYDKDKQSKSLKPKVSTLLSILDTTLLKTYLQTNDSKIEILLREGRCHFEESEKTLIKYRKFSELKILYNTNGKHQKALELLKSQSENSGTRLFGVEQTIKYLQRLGPEHKYLIFEFSDWVLKKDPKAGLKIFTENFDEVKSLPRPEVLDFLLKGHKTLVIPYLEHIIDGWNEKNPMFHNYLINQYRKEIDSLKNTLSKDNNAIEASEALKNVRYKLFCFLKTSNIYAPENVLKDLPTNDLFEERAIILGKLKKHKKVLVIYYQVLGDIEKAKEYCEEVYQEDNNILVHLIEILLTKPDSPPYNGVTLHPICLQPNTEIVLGLLDKYGTKIDPVEVLMCLPNDIPIHRLKTFLENSLRAKLEKRRHCQVLNGLLYAQDLQLKEQLMHHEMKSIVLTDYSVCPICKKRFTNQSAFVKYPDGKIVHFSCQDKITN